MSSIIAICGREGAGKTTVSQILTKPNQITYVKLANPLDYIVNILFGYVNNKEFLKNQIMQLFRDKIDPKFTFPKLMLAPVLSPADDVADDQPPGWQKYISYAFADPLKQIASIIFDFEIIDSSYTIYEILLADVAETRTLRTQMQTRDYQCCGRLNGRECLEYLGTDILRDALDTHIWINIFKRSMMIGKKYLITDMRYENEYDALKDLNVKVIVIYRQLDDLILTDHDQQQHPAKWSFLTFIKKIINITYIHNNGTIIQLGNTVKHILK